jgi:DNA topoisomerase II
MDAADAQKEIQSFSAEEHVRKKGMWAGSAKRVAIPGLTGAVVEAAEDGDTYKLCSLATPLGHAPALFKCFDELATNATDHAVECALKPSKRKYAKVTYIRLTFLPDGIFVIENDGPGIPVVKHIQISAEKGRDIFIPEIAFCMMFSGSNMTKKAENVKGGINGVGATIANIHSVLFRYTTVAYDTDGSRRLYTQKCEERMHKIHPPQIVDLKKGWSADKGPLPTPHTQVKMLPVYGSMGYTQSVNPAAPPEMQQAARAQWAHDYAGILAWLQLRACQMAAYVGPSVQVVLNGRPITTTGPLDLACLYLTKSAGVAEDAVALETKMKPSELPYKKHPWSIAVILSPHIRQFDHVSIINGVVTASGAHITHLKGLFKEATIAKLAKVVKEEVKVSVKDVCQHMLLVVVGALPGADWDGQRKDNLSVSKEALAHYKFPVTWLKQVADICSGMILEAMGRKKKGKKKTKPEKYTPAKSAGIRGPPASLMAAEGDSAIATLKTGLGLGPKKNPGGPTFQTYGVFSLGGVPMNAMKKVSELKTVGADGKPILIRKQQLEDNKMLNALMQIVNLDYGLTYETGAERAKLHYAEIILCVDQDLDGAGKIIGIFLANFNRFWPALIKHGFLKWFMTPVIRIYPIGAKTGRARAAAGPVVEFYHEGLYEEWVEAAGGVAAVAAKYQIRYYKGLGGHDDLEIPSMFQDFRSRLYTFALDDDADRLFGVYYGVPTAPRKLALSTTATVMPRELVHQIDTSRIVPCSAQLNFYTKAFKLDAIQRQIPGALDSMTEGRRKAFDGLRQLFNHGNGERMTYQAAAHAAATKCYHHGSVSIENAIIGMAQSFPGKRPVPVLIGSGAFGTQIEGGKDAASPRYTRISLNVDVCKLLYPPVDDWNLRYVYSDGQQAEPVSFIPIVCTTVIDNMTTPSEGWRYHSWGRRVSQVFEITLAFCDAAHPGHDLVRGLIDAPPEAAPVEDAASAPPSTRAQMYAQFVAKFPLNISLQGLPGRVQVVRGKLHHFGVYHVETARDDPQGDKGAIIKVTSLPIRVWSKPFSKSLVSPGKEKKPNAREEFILSVDDYSGADHIDVVVRLKPGALMKIAVKYNKSSEMDYVENFLGLHTSLTSILNVVRPSPVGHGGVIELGEDYHALVIHHLPYRREAYRRRYHRQQQILLLQIRMEEEILRYIALSAELQISKIDNEETVGRLLKEQAFPRIALSAVRSPGFTPIEQLPHLIVEATEAPEVRPSSTYNYILNLQERELLGSSKRKRIAKLEKLRSELQEVEAVLQEKPFAAASIWKKELHQLAEVLRRQNRFT